MENVVPLQSLLQFTLRNRRRILTVFVSTVAVVMVGTFLLPKTYEATSLVLVKFGREYTYRPELGDTPQNIPDRSRQTFVNTELQILHSQDLIESVVTGVGVNKLYPGLSNDPKPSDRRLVQAAVNVFSGNLAADHMPDSNVLRVTFHHSVPKLTAKALNMLIESFKAKHLEAFSDPQATAFLEAKVASYRDALAKSEEKLKAFQLEIKSSSVDDQRTAVYQQRRDVETALKDARN